jgi:hypothetical protein
MKNWRRESQDRDQCGGSLRTVPPPEEDIIQTRTNILSRMSAATNGAEGAWSSSGNVLDS